MTDSKQDEQVSFFFEAVHFVLNGSIYALAEPNRLVHYVSYGNELKRPLRLEFGQT